MADHAALALAQELAPRLALLRAVAEEGHLTRAAQRLGIPQPTASRWLAELSAKVGTPLVVRDGRGIRCSRLGTELASGAAAALAALESACRQVVALADPERGQVALAFLHTMGEQRVPDLLGRFRTRHPDVRFTLRQGGHEDVLEWVRTGEVDLGITSPLPTTGFVTARVAELALAVTVPAGHRLAGRRRVRLSELAGERFVGLKRRYGLRGITDDLCAAAGFVPVLAFEGDEVGTLRGMVAAGLGVAILPTAEHPLGECVVELPITPRASRVIGLVWTAEEALAPAAVHFRDFVLDTAEGGPEPGPPS